MEVIDRDTKRRRKNRRKRESGRRKDPTSLRVSGRMRREDF